MRAAKTGLVIGFALGAGLAAAGWWIYGQRSRERIAGIEGLDDPAVARGYEFMAGLPHMRAMRWVLARMATKMRARGEAVDLGCGPGLLAIEMASGAPDLHVTGVELSEEMLRQGEENARRAGLSERVAFRGGDAARIPFDDDSVDLIVSTLSLHHWEDPTAVLDEVARVLRPAGSFLIFDLRRDMPAPAYLLIWFVTRVVVPAALKRAREPLGSRDAAYTPDEAAELAGRSRLRGWRVAAGPLWLIIEGTMPGPTECRRSGGGA